LHLTCHSFIIMGKQKISYSEAVAEIEEILNQIEKGELDVDDLTEKVRRVTFLIKSCKSKLLSTEEEINAILDKEEKVEE
jgi:exodeoxyribonuclease VII small subunit